MQQPGGGILGLLCIAAIAIPIGFIIGVAINSAMLRAAAWLIGDEDLDGTTATTMAFSLVLANMAMSFVVAGMMVAGSLPAQLQLGHMISLAGATLFIDTIVLMCMGVSFSEALAMILALNFLFSPLTLLQFTVSLR